MDLTILWRLGPALLVGLGVARAAMPVPRPRPGEVLDEGLRFLVAGLVAGRLGWLLLSGPTAWEGLPSTLVLVRSGVDFWIGMLAAAIVLGRAPLDDRVRLIRALPTALFAGLAVWHGLCEVEGVCGGTPAGWGVVLPGYATRVVPTGYIEAGVLALLAVITWHVRRHPDVRQVAGSLFGLVAARYVLGEFRPTLSPGLTRDQVLTSLLGSGLALWAWFAWPRWERRAAMASEHEGDAVTSEDADA